LCAHPYLDIERRIGFRISQALRLGQHLFELEPFSRISDKMKFEVPLMIPRSTRCDCSQALTKRLDDRHASGNRRFEGAMTPSFARQKNLVAMCRQQCLVGGYDVLAAVDRRQNQVHRNFGAPINSITMSISGLRTTLYASSVISAASPTTLRALPRSLSRPS